MKLKTLTVIAALAAPPAFLVFDGPALFLVVFALATLFGGVSLLWHRDLSPIFLFIFAYQWCQASMMVFQSAVMGVQLDDLIRYGGDVAKSTALSLCALVTLAVGLRAGLGLSATGFTVKSRLSIDDRTPQFWFGCYIASAALSLAITTSSELPGGLRQPLLAAAYVKWAFYWILTRAALQRTGIVRWQWAFAFAVELVHGASGLFSGFSQVIFYTAFALLGHARMTPVRWFGTAALAALAIFLGVCWAAIKNEHRQFITADERTQAVAVGAQERLASIARMVASLDAQRLEVGALELARRIGYVEFFGVVVVNVPSYIPFQDGALLADAIARPFMPRLLFPEKSEIDDSERTNEFTGLRLSGREDGTSISLGYVAEMYIDFGAPLMFVPIFFLGFVAGRYYRWITHYRHSQGLVGIGLGTVTLFQMAYFETSITKLVGGLLVSMLVSALLARWGAVLLTPRKRPVPGTVPPPARGA